MPDYRFAMIEYTVTAIRYQMGDDLSAEGQKQAAIEFVAGLKIGQQVLLAAEPENPVDDKAVAVYINFERTGYIATEQCDEVQQYLDEHRQGRGVIERTDGHLTFFISIPNSPEKPETIESRKRILPESPLDENVKLPYTREESKLQLLATKLLNMDVNEQSIQPIIDMAELYLPLAKLSICHADGYWRDKIFKKLTRIKKQVNKFGLSEDDESRLDVAVHRLREVVGDMHRSSDHWSERVFENHLNSLRNNKIACGHLYDKYCDAYLDKKPFSEADQRKMVVERTRLLSWLESMKWSELRNYKQIKEIGFRVNYLGLSRKEIYDLFAVILLIEKIDEVLRGNQRAEVSTEIPVLECPDNPLDGISPNAQNEGRLTMPIKQFSEEELKTFSLDAIHKEHWRAFCDVCYPRFGFEEEGDGERTYEQKYDTFRHCHIFAKEQFNWDVKEMLKVHEHDFKRFKQAYALFASLTTEDNACIPMVLVLLRMQQSIWNRLKEDGEMIEFIYPRKREVDYDEYKIEAANSPEWDNHLIKDLGGLEKAILDGLYKERSWDEEWTRAISESKDDAGSLSQTLARCILGSYNYSLEEFANKYNNVFSKGGGNVIKAITFRLFTTYQISLAEVKAIFEDYPEDLCFSKLTETREELIREFHQTRLGKHWCECIRLPKGLEKVGKYLINHRDSISEEEEARFFYLLDEICIITDILRGNAAKYWLNVEYETKLAVEQFTKEADRHEPTIVEAIQEQTEVLKKIAAEPRIQNNYNLELVQNKGVNIEKNYGPNIDNHDGGTVGLPSAGAVPHSLPNAGGDKEQ